MSAALQRVIKIFLKHTYTYIDVASVASGDDNGGYNDIMLDADPITEQKCLFFFEDIETSTSSGIILMHTPTLYVLHNDPIQVKDNVSNVLNEDGLVLLESASVMSIDNTAEIGGAIVKVCRLSGATAV